MKSETAVAPQPAAVTPELLAQHSITAEEYSRILAALGRTPSLTELGIYSVMWSEHCSYKSSRVHLKRLPTKSDRVVQGPGENAGIIDVGDGWACAFKIESHNHPSYIEPFQGAATGVGGILRDIFTMNARPLAVMDSLRFGPIEKEPTCQGREVGRRDVGHPASGLSDDIIRKNHSILEGVVHGIAAYGNCFGVPNLGGETRFEPCYSGNPLVNAFALGLVRRDEIFYAKASGVGNPVIYAGAKTGRDGIHGATMASEEFKEGSEQKRPNVQVGDPFMEKLLLEACLEVMKTGAGQSSPIVGIQDMGAAGLTSSSCEMGARGGVGLEMNLNQVPQRETGMTAYEMMLSESQERMLLVAEKGREQEVLDVFFKWGLDATIVGTVIAEPRLRIVHNGEVVADIPNRSLTDDAPRYHRPIGTWKAPVPLDPPAEVLEELKKPRDYTADLKKLLASSNICSKRWVFEQYDSMVQTNTVQGPGGEAGVMRIKGTNRGLAMALDGNSRWCYLDPKQGAKLAVAEAARKVACTGATPVAATNCLNFGNPEKPEIMAQFSETIDGIAEACTALGTPITGGNVSLYNETRGEGIYPTPIIGIVGIIDDVTKAVGSDFRKESDAILWLWPDAPEDAEVIEREEADREALRRFGSSEFAKDILKSLWGKVPSVELPIERNLLTLLGKLANRGLIYSARDVSDGGMAVALAESGFHNGLGADVNIFDNVVDSVQELKPYLNLFSEFGDVLITCNEIAIAEIEAVAGEFRYFADKLGNVTNGNFDVMVNKVSCINSTIADLKQSWSRSLEQALHDNSANEVLA
jgi:phosphoribosylformylglycinamidine synthase subunit PurL